MAAPRIVRAIRSDRSDRVVLRDMPAARAGSGRRRDGWRRARQLGCRRCLRPSRHEPCASRAVHAREPFSIARETDPGAALRSNVPGGERQVQGQTGTGVGELCRDPCLASARCRLARGRPAEPARDQADSPAKRQAGHDLQGPSGWPCPGRCRGAPAFRCRARRSVWGSNRPGANHAAPARGRNQTGLSRANGGRLRHLANPTISVPARNHCRQYVQHRLPNSSSAPSKPAGHSRAGGKSGRPVAGALRGSGERSSGAR